jgi:hypothetical protein
MKHRDATESTVDLGLKNRDRTVMASDNGVSWECLGLFTIIPHEKPPLMGNMTEYRSPMV